MNKEKINIPYLYLHCINNKKAPETGACVGVWCVCGVGVRRGVAGDVRSQVVGMVTSRGARDETGGAHASGARASGARASGAGDAVNGKYEKKTVTVDAPRYQVDRTFCTVKNFPNPVEAASRIRA